MTTRPSATLKAALSLLTLSALATSGLRSASANQNQDPGATPPVADPAGQPLPLPTDAPGLPPPPPGMAPPPSMAQTGMAPAVVNASTDHDSVVGRWGIEVRRLASPLRSTKGRTCGTAPCPVDLNSFGLRRWSAPKYAWGVGLALALGGGSRREGAPAEAKTLDTYFGFGPTLSSSFLLANWKHLAVSAGPQLDLVYFIPSGSSPKTLLINLRGVVEGEVHLGFMGLPALSVGLQTGLGAHFQLVTKGKTPVEGQTATDWGVSTLGPTALWDLVTQAYLRFYF